MSDEPYYLDAPPPPPQRVPELYVWVATYPDGSEGIVSADMPTPIGRRHMPLMASKRNVAEALESMARIVQRAAVDQAGRIVSIRLVTFRAQP